MRGNEIFYVTISCTIVLMCGYTKTTNEADLKNLLVYETTTLYLHNN